MDSTVFDGWQSWDRFKILLVFLTGIIVGFLTSPTFNMRAELDHRSPLEEALLKQNRGGLVTEDPGGLTKQFGIAEITPSTWQPLYILDCLEVEVSIGKIRERILVQKNEFPNDGKDLEGMADSLNKIKEPQYVHVFARQPKGQAGNSALWGKVTDIEP